MDKLLNEIAPVWQRVVEFAIERVWIDYFLFLIPLIVPLTKETLFNYTVFVAGVTLFLLFVRAVLKNTGPWGAMRYADSYADIPQNPTNKTTGPAPRR